MHNTTPQLVVCRLVLAFLLIPSLAASASAQVAERNVNMVSGGTFPGGDPFLQKQNEPSLAVSTRNPCHLLAGANDYRAVNLPGLPGDAEIGDAWLGWYESTDCGATWYSTLVPGFLQDSSVEGNASPVKGLTAGADPVVRAGGSGTFYYLFIAFNRGSNVGKLALALGIDHNDRETFINPDTVSNVSTRRQLSPIKYAGTTEIARGSSGQFIDKPHLAVFPGTGTCVVDGETIPANNVYVSWTEFIGNNPDNLRSKVYFARSADCGKTLAGPATKLTEGFPLNQGSVIAVNPLNPQDIYVVWRQIRSDRTQDAILFARSTDGGRSFTKAEPIPGLGEGQYKPFDQNTTSPLINATHTTVTFRTLGYVTAAFADDGFLYLALAEPLAPNPNSSLGGVNSRIMILRTDGVTWYPRVQAIPSSLDGHQIMPALAYAAGKLQLIWYDLRFDESGLTSQPLIDEKQALAQTKKIRHTLDVMGAQAVLPQVAWPPAADFFKPYGVSQPDFNDPPSPNGPPVLRGPRISQYLTGDADGDPNTPQGGARTLQHNLGNLFLYGGGRIPFIGDYIDIAGTQFVRNGAGQWVLNGLLNKDNIAFGTFHATWTDNRDATIGTVDPSGVLPYKAPLTLPVNATLQNAPSCEGFPNGIDITRTRDANVYTSRITQDFSLTAPGNAKPTNTAGVARAFAVQLTNGTDTDATFTLSLTEADASFSRFTFRGPSCAMLGARIASIPITVLKRSSVTRTVYVKCSASPAKLVIVTATRNTPQPVASASLAVNADPSNPPAKGANGQPLGPESHTPDAENPDAENPDAENPDAENPDAENPDAENPDAENPDAENPDAENPDAENPDAENPDAENPDAENANFQDVSVDVTNDGDTTSGYQVKFESSSSTSGYQFLLLAHRVYATPTSINCYRVRRYTNEQLFAIPNPDLTQGFADENDSTATNATVLVRPGESIRVRLRVVWNSATTPTAFCSADPNSPDYCFKKLLFRTRAQAPNTGQLDPDEDSEGDPPGPDLVVDGTLSTTPTIAGILGFVDSPGATISNVGNDGASGFSWNSFISSDVTGRLFTGEFGFFDGTLGSDESTPSGPMRVQIPSSYFSDGETSSPLPPGNYFVGLQADTFNNVAEGKEFNNTRETATPITVVQYTASFPDNGNVGQGFTFSRTVRVTGPGGALISGATVALSLEGPNTTGTAPGTPASFADPQPSPGVTNAAGEVTFANLSIGPEGDNYRLIATVTIPAVGTTPLKFQSAPFNVNFVVP